MTLGSAVCQKITSPEQVSANLSRSQSVDQFRRLRDGDRLWYQRIFHGPFRRLLDNTTLARVIHRNTDVTGLQPNVFFMANSQPDRDPDSTIVTALDTPAVNDNPGNLGAAPGSHIGLQAVAIDPPVRQAPVNRSTTWQPIRDSRIARDRHPTRADESALQRHHEAVFADVGNEPFEAVR